MGCFHRRLHQNITYQNEPWKIIHTSTPKTSLSTSENRPIGRPEGRSEKLSSDSPVRCFPGVFAPFVDVFVDIYIPGGGLAVSRNITSKVKIYGARFKRWLDRHVFNVSSSAGKVREGSTSNGVPGTIRSLVQFCHFKKKMRPQKHPTSNAAKIFKCPGCPSKDLVTLLIFNGIPLFNVGLQTQRPDNQQLPFFKGNRNVSKWRLLNFPTEWEP